MEFNKAANTQTKSTLPFDVLLFDLGDTLVYFDGDWSEVWNRADRVLDASLRAAGMSLPAAFIQDFRQRMQVYYRQRDTEFIEYTMLYMLRTMILELGLKDIPDSVLQKGLDDMFTITQAHWQPETDALSTLQALRQRGYRLGMVSNSSDDSNVYDLVDKARVRSFFEIILTSAAEGIRKPNPRIFRKALDFFGVLPQRAAMIGDTLGADILGAQNTGMSSIWVTRRANVPGNQAHADTITPDAAVATLTELVDLLDHWNG